MKFVCDKSSLLREVSIAQEIISSRNTLSILSNVLLAANESSLVIKATDTKVGFETQIPVEVQTPGDTTVFCDKLLGILRSLPEGEVEFELQDQRLDIRPLYKRIDFQLKSIASDMYPELHDVSEENYFTFPQRDLIEMITQTIFAVSDDETRYFMNGVFLECREGEIIMVATDGLRLSFIKKVVEGDIGSFEGVIIPPKALNLIRKLSTGEGNVDLAVTKENVFVKYDTQRLSSSLIEGQFPNYNRVIPENQEHKIVVERNDFLDALSRVSLLVEQKSRKVFVTANENNLLLHCEESEIGIAREEIECEYDGPEISIALNYQFLMEPLRVMEDEKVAIRFTDEKKAVSIVSPEEKEYIHIVAPMQLD